MIKRKLRWARVTYKYTLLFPNARTPLQLCKYEIQSVRTLSKKKVKPGLNMSRRRARDKHMPRYQNWGTPVTTIKTICNIGIEIVNIYGLHHMLLNRASHFTTPHKKSRFFFYNDFLLNKFVDIHSDCFFNVFFLAKPTPISSGRSQFIKEVASRHIRMAISRHWDGASIGKSRIKKV